MQHHVPRRLAGLALAASGLLALAPAAASAARNVTVRVEGTRGTIQREVTVTTSGHRSVGLPGDPTCKGTSALGALDAAVGGAWSGPYYDGLGYQPAVINGHRPNPKNSYFGFWIDHHYASTGLCQTFPRNGGDVLLFTTPFTEPKGGLLPLGLRAPRTAVAGRAFRVRVVVYAKNGRATGQRGARVAVGRTFVPGHTRTFTTGRGGYVTLRATRGTDLTLRASKAGRVRSEYETVDVR